MGGCMGKGKPVKHENTWPLPYLTKLEGNTIQPGQSILINGWCSEKGQFDIILSSGPRVYPTEKERDDQLLVINTQMDKKAIVLSALKNNEKQAEKKLKNPFKVGHEYNYRIRVHEDRFEIFANRKSLGEYPLNASLNAINHIYVAGECELTKVAWEGKYYNMPYEALIPDNFKVGRLLKVSGEWVVDKAKDKPEQLQINAFAGNDIALHVNPRIKAKAIVRNWQEGGKWQKEEKGKLPMKIDENFEIAVSCDAEHFVITINEVEYCKFKHHKDPLTIDKIQIDGDIDLHSVHLK